MTGSQRISQSPVTVREATLGDAEAVHALSVELADALGDRRPRFETVRARLRELLDESGARVLVAQDQSEIVGAASLWVKPDLAHGDTVVEVPMLVVSKEARRRGIGRLLIGEIKSTAAAEDAAIVELVATPDNEPARAFYRSLGFVETDHVALEFVGEMEKALDPEE